MAHRYPRAITDPHPVAATAITDPTWLTAAVSATARRFRLARRATAGVLWWYSASSVLLGPVAETYVRGGRVADPGLAAMTLFPHSDGRVLDGRSASHVDRAVAPAAVADVVSACVAAVVAVSGAAERTLWAVASDSLGNRVLWAGGGAQEAVALAADDRFPVPRFVSVGAQQVVRRSSCCLVYESPGTQKCVSCPRQQPAERRRRLRRAFGQDA